MKLTYSQGRSNKIHISTDGEYRLTVDADFWFSLGVYNNSEISEEEFSELEEKITVRRAYNKGIDLLSRRAHAKKELIDKISKTYEKKYVIIAVNALEEKGYVNDEDFAEQYYSYLKERKHFGKKRISLELAKKGIDKGIIATLCEADCSSPSEEIEELLSSKFQTNLADEKGRKRAFNALVRMGYNYGDIRSAMQNYEFYED